MKILAQLKTLMLSLKTFKASTLLIAFFALSACGGMTSGPQETAKRAAPEPAPREEVFSKLRADGTMWMNEQNEKVSLRGINLGNWLMMEMWMFGDDQIFGDGIVDQCTLEDALDARFGEAEKDRLFKLHRDNWMTEKDWDVMESAGFNVVRIPFPYDLIEDDDNPKTLKSDAWHYLDWAIAEAKERRMYVILDLHGAAGRQGWEHHSGCAGKNELWGSATYRDRTIWLWEQIAQKYKDEDAIAGYGLLNEPWGTDPKTMSDFGVELYQAVRQYDNEHIVILPGHSEGGGFSDYGDPLDLGMQNVAFEMHYYPGIFGWGDISYETHRDWLRCNPESNTTVCGINKRLQSVYTPILIGELQPWTSLGELGGEITRATFDRYNQLNWAATAWSLKTVSGSGSQGAGRWGIMTNKGDQLLVKSTTWACDDWESSFADACDIPATSIVPNKTEETQTMYLVIKVGSEMSTDVVFDEIELTNDETGENIIINGGFGNASGWQEVSILNSLPTIDYNYVPGEFAGDETGAALRIHAPDGNHNAAIYQPIQVEAGASYTISGKFKDLIGGVTKMWAEIYLVPDEPQQGVDVLGTVLVAPNVNSSTLQEFEAYFSLFADMDYELNHWVIDALARKEPARVYNNIPSAPSGFDVDVVRDDEDQLIENILSWSKTNDAVDGYRVYRSISQKTGYEVVAEVDATTTTYSEVYGADGLDPEVTYYYYISAFNSTDESFASDIVQTGENIFALPGRIEAESFADAHPGVRIETAGDTDGGGFNIGHFETDRWVEYKVNSIQEGTYNVDLRLASLVGDVQFEIQIDRKDGADPEVIKTVTVPNTGGWQIYQTESYEVELPAGEFGLRLHSLDNQWNLNWIEFSADLVDVETPAQMTEAFGGALVEEIAGTPTFTFPSDAMGWAGFANGNQDLYPISFMESGIVSFTGSVPSGESVDIYFRFEKNIHPDVDPAYNTQLITISGSEPKNYSVSIPSQNNNVFRSFIMYVTTPDEPVAISNIGVFGDTITVVESVAQDVEKYEIANPISLSDGSNATATFVEDNQLGKDVVALQVDSNNQTEQGYVSFILNPSVDFTQASKLEFKVLDQQGSNTVYITLVDESGETWSAWTSEEMKSIKDLWKTIELDYSAAANTCIDLSRISAIRFGEWNAGSYRFSDVALHISTDNLDTNDSCGNAGQQSQQTSVGIYAIGPNATGTIVIDDQLEKEVIELEVLANDNIEQAYASLPTDQQDFSNGSMLEFGVLDQQGSNTVYVTLVDGNGDTWSGWSSDGSKTVLNQWTTIQFDYSAAANTIDLAQVTAVRLAQWNAGTYRFSDMALLAASETAEAPQPQSVGIYTIGPNATGTIVTDAELGKEVIELQVLTDNNMQQSYVSFPFQEQDFTNTSLEFKVFDLLGSNTVYVTLVDANGATWSNWTVDEEASKTVANQWTTMAFDYPAARYNIDITSINEVRLSLWHAGTYRFADLIVE